MSARLLFGAALAAASLAAPASAAGTLPFRISAAADVSYALDCKFSGVRVGGALVNQLAFTAKGPRTGRIPTDNARCRIKKTAGAGPVTFTVVKDKTYAATVAAAGQEAAVTVW